ncbi:uncharacterized protein LOC117645855 isoform X2 [Thrips palmi]|nr:uncharacterized protein LOC117645855 isoform X2 [Thrips palmi]
MIRAALALAPCLASIRRPEALSMRALASHVLSTACVVEMLDSDVCASDEVPYAISIFLKLSALGGLKELSLFFGDDLQEETPLLLKAIYNLSLQTLDIAYYGGGSLPPLPASWCDVEVGPSLTHLDYRSRRVDPFLELLLRTHAETLEVVDLRRTKNIPVALLSKMPRLRCLRCVPINDLMQLVAVPNLQSLELICVRNLSAFLHDVESFLCVVSQLRRVKLELEDRSIPTDAFLLALSRSPSAPILEALTVKGLIGSLRPVTFIPAEFLSLQCLHLGLVPSDEMLRSVSPTSLPSLTTLTVEAPRDTCLHSWLHYPAVQDVLLRNKGLHLRVSRSKAPEDCACPWCRWGCHVPLGCDFSFSAHARRAGCPVKCLQVVHPVTL